MMLHIKYKAMGLVISNKIFHVSLISLCKTCDPMAGPFLATEAQLEQTWQGSTRVEYATY